MSGLFLVLTVGSKQKVSEFSDCLTTSRLYLWKVGLQPKEGTDCLVQTNTFVGPMLKKGTTGSYPNSREYRIKKGTGMRLFASPVDFVDV